MATFAGLGAAHGLRAQEATAGTLFDWTRSKGFTPAEIASSLRSYGIRPFANSFALEMGPDIVVDPRFRAESEEFKSPSRPESQLDQEAETGALDTGGSEPILPQEGLDFTKNSIDASKSAASARAPEGKGAYEDVKGHHIFAKSGFRGHAAYDPQKGFSISKELMNSRDWSHKDMTSAQHKLFNELGASGRPNTLTEHTKIAVEALKAGGATEREAQEIVDQALQDLRNQGILTPTRIPWKCTNSGDKL